jgi:hypothetical protein
MGSPSKEATFLGAAETWKVYANAAAASGSLFMGNSYPRGVIFSAGGTLVVTKLDGTPETIPDHGGAFPFPCQFKAITGGTATNFTVLWED